MISFNFAKLVLVVALCVAHVTCAEEGKQASAGPISDFLNTVRAPKIGYAPGVHQAVANTGAQPNPVNLIPGLGNLGGSSQGPFKAFEGFAQAGQNALAGFAQASGQIFNAALQPVQQLAQALLNPKAASGSAENSGRSLFSGGLFGHLGNITKTPVTAGKPPGS